MTATDRRRFDPTTGLVSGGDASALDSAASPRYRSLPDEATADHEFAPTPEDPHECLGCRAKRATALDSAASRPDRPAHPLFAEVLAAREKAHAKHGANSIESVPAGDSRWLPILGEEFGEVCGTQTYDKDAAELRAELIDTLAVASAWADALDRDGMGAISPIWPAVLAARPRTLTRFDYPQRTDPTDPRWLPALGDQVGLVCETLAIDPGVKRLRSDLIGVLAVASAWVDAIDQAAGLTWERAEPYGEADLATRLTTYCSARGIPVPHDQGTDYLAGEVRELLDAIASGARHAITYEIADVALALATVARGLAVEGCLAFKAAGLVGAVRDLSIAINRGDTDAVRKKMPAVMLALTAVAEAHGLSVEACIEAKTAHDTGRGAS